MINNKSKTLKLAVIGAGFWSQNQLNAWNELEKEGLIEFHSICDVDNNKAKAMKDKFDFTNIFNEPNDMFIKGGFDFVDIITPTETHYPLVKLSARYKIPAICQKPLGSSLNEAIEMVKLTKEANIPLIVHENFRWQPNIQAFKKELHRIGKTIGIELIWTFGAFNPYAAQPYFKDQERFIIGDVGVHIIDVARYLLESNVKLVFAQTGQIKEEIKGEDFAELSLRMENNTSVRIVLSYATPLVKEAFPQILIRAYGKKGTLNLGLDFNLSFTYNENGRNITESKKIIIPKYSWADSTFNVVLVSMGQAHTHYLESIINRTEAHTSGRDNLNTLAASYGAYLSAEKEESVRVDVLDLLNTQLEKHLIGYPQYPD